MRSSDNQILHGYYSIRQQAAVYLFFLQQICPVEHVGRFREAKSQNSPSVASVVIGLWHGLLTTLVGHGSPAIR